MYCEPDLIVEARPLGDDDDVDLYGGANLPAWQTVVSPFGDDAVPQSLYGKGDAYTPPSTYSAAPMPTVDATTAPSSVLTPDDEAAKMIPDQPPPVDVTQEPTAPPSPPQPAPAPVPVVPPPSGPPIKGTMPPELAERGVMVLIARMKNGATVICEHDYQPVEKGPSVRARMPPKFRGAGCCVMVMRLRDGRKVVAL